MAKYKVGDLVLWDNFSIEKIINIWCGSYKVKVIKLTRVDSMYHIKLDSIYNENIEYYDNMSRLLTDKDKLELL